MTQKSRGILIAGNWKMNYGHREVAEFFTTLKNDFQENPFSIPAGLKSYLIPSYLCLEKTLNFCADAPYPITVAAQNALGEERGAFTGEVSGQMLRDIGIQSVLIGHSERRHIFGETHELIRQKTVQLLAQKMQVILCIGETRAEREAGKTQAVLSEQILSVFKKNETSLERLTIAYEPVWAIGTGLTATPEQANEAHTWIRQILKDCLGDAIAARIPLLYGGSVTPKNIESLLNCPEVDGALVGGASLKAPDFMTLMRTAARILA